ncbi:hypothetical protein [Planctomycetes bacterium TBK1r]|uniref:hypothetical protein n=1 Tax=Stieleria magnilauensis TaxID=2527963 RepID=UPI0011A51749
MYLEPFRVGHPGLEYVSQGWEGWVQTDLDTRNLRSSNAKESEIDRVAASPIHKLGYRVGKQGVSTSTRRTILSNAFTGEIPFIKSDSYMKEWGGPRTSKRLRRIAQLLASNINNCAKRANSMSYQEAIEDWRDDLEWLKRNYYNGVHRFDWPSAKVGR